MNATTEAISKPKRVSILGTQVTVTCFDEAIRLLEQLVCRRSAGCVSCANAYSVMLASQNSDYQRILNRAALVIPDGMSVVWASRLLHCSTERVHCDDLVLSCCRQFPEWRHFLVGGRVGQPELVEQELKRRYPWIRIAGWVATPERPLSTSQTNSIIQQIRELQPDLVWVGMGTPAQDIWMEGATQLADTTMIGVGSLFDLLSGRTRPAPDWMKRSGLQWLFRLIQEPRRLLFRYMFFNTMFMFRFGLQLLSNTYERGTTS